MAERDQKIYDNISRNDPKKPFNLRRAIQTVQRKKKRGKRSAQETKDVLSKAVTVPRSPELNAALANLHVDVMFTGDNSHTSLDDIISLFEETTESTKMQLEVVKKNNPHAGIINNFKEELFDALTNLTLLYTFHSDIYTPPESHINSGLEKAYACAEELYELGTELLPGFDMFVPVHDVVGLHAVMKQKALRGIKPFPLSMDGLKKCVTEYVITKFIQETYDIKKEELRVPLSEPEEYAKGPIPITILFPPKERMRRKDAQIYLVSVEEQGASLLEECDRNTRDRVIIADWMTGSTVALKRLLTDNAPCLVDRINELITVIYENYPAVMQKIERRKDSKRAGSPRVTVETTKDKQTRVGKKIYTGNWATYRLLTKAVEPWIEAVYPLIGKKQRGKKQLERGIVEHSKPIEKLHGRIPPAIFSWKIDAGHPNYFHNDPSITEERLRDTPLNFTNISELRDHHQLVKVDFEDLILESMLRDSCAITDTFYSNVGEAVRLFEAYKSLFLSVVRNPDKKEIRNYKELEELIMERPTFHTIEPIKRPRKDVREGRGTTQTKRDIDKYFNGIATLSQAIIKRLDSRLQVTQEKINSWYLADSFLYSMENLTSRTIPYLAWCNDQLIKRLHSERDPSTRSFICEPEGSREVFIKKSYQQKDGRAQMLSHYHGLLKLRDMYMRAAVFYQRLASRRLDYLLAGKFKAARILDEHTSSKISGKKNNETKEFFDAHYLGHDLGKLFDEQAFPNRTDQQKRLAIRKSYDI